MSEEKLTRSTREQRELDQEQALLDLDQSISHREQIRVDQEQEVSDERQGELDAQLSKTGPDEFEIRANIAQLQAELLRAQMRRDAHQDQLDSNQGGLELRQEVLDAELIEGGQPGNATDSHTTRGLEALSGTGEDAARQRAEAARQRAEAALSRAEEARRRAEAALARANALAERRPKS